MDRQRTIEEVWRILREVQDPEIPALSLVDLNVVRDVHVAGSAATVRLVPTYSGCPALDRMKEDVESKLLSAGFDAVHVHIDRTGHWSTDDLPDSAKEALRAFGIAPPRKKLESLRATLVLPVECPMCGSKETQLESEFGSTLCKQLFYCLRCRQSFDRFKPL